MYGLRGELHNIAVSKDPGQLVEEKRSLLVRLLMKADDLIGEAWDEDEDEEEEEEEVEVVGDSGKKK